MLEAGSSEADQATVDLELALIRAVLHADHPQSQRHALDRVPVDAFAVDAHRDLWREIVAFARRHGTVDPAAMHGTIATWASTHGLTPSVVVGGTYRPSLIPKYVEEIRAASRTRRVVDAGRRMAAEPDRAEAIARGLLEDEGLAAGGPADLVLDVGDLAGDFDRTLAGDDDAGVSTGLISLDDHLTLARGQISVWTGVPSHGKSTVVDAIAVNLARDHGWRTCIWTPEAHPYGRHHTPELVRRYIGKPWRDGPVPPMSGEEAAAGFAWVGEHFTYIDPAPTRDLDTVIAAADVAMRRRPFDLLILDPFTEFARPPDVRLHDFVHDALTAVDQFVQRHDVHAIVTAHPRKPQTGSRRPPVPTAYDIAESSHWANRADVIVAVWRLSTDDHRVLIDVQKVRFRSIGKPGQVWVEFDPRTYRLHDLEPSRWPEANGHPGRQPAFDSPV